MQEFKSFSKRLETLTLDQFDDLALDLFQFQAIHKQSFLVTLIMDLNGILQVFI